MDKETFDRILIEEGIDLAEVRNMFWNGRPSNLTEEDLRSAVKELKTSGDYLRYKTRKALNDAMNRASGRDK